MKRRFSAIFLAMVFLFGLMVSSTPLFSKVIVGEEVSDLYETTHPYQGVRGVVWEQRFTWPNAGYISIHFSNFSLADGDYVEISSPNGRFIRRYRGLGKEVEGGQISNFWASHIPGDAAVVKLVSRNLNGGYGFVIDKWARGYDPEYIREVMSALEEEATMMEAICGADDKEWAKCYDGTQMYEKSKAVCRLLIQGTTACTGWLVGSAGHVITCHHCIEDAAAALDTDYEFMAEGADCTTDCSSWGACPGVVVAESGTMIKTDEDLDYSLILLPDNPSETYGFLQLRNTLPTIGERIYIPQHPGAYGKQLAVNSDTDGPYGKVYSTDETPCIGGPGDIGYYVDTAGGSSGSPVIAYDDNCVVSLHHCANCPNRGVPIPPIITHMGTDLPPDAICSSTPQPPEAQFIADKTVVQINDSVQFTDLSSFVPTSWSWTFEGGDPGTFDGKNPPAITYNTLGKYTVSLTVENALGTDTETKEEYIEVKEVVLDYCASAGSTYTYEWIEEVGVGDFVNTSGAAGYSDFTNLTIDLAADETFDVLLTPGFASYAYTEYWKIWIDYNIDGDFEDAGEEVFSGYGTTPVSGNFTVPVDAEGETRMRVSMKWNDWPTPCETFSYGEVEDYTVNIKGIGILFETGVVDQVTSSWQTVTLQKNYVAPVVVCTVNYRTAEDPAVARVRNAAGNSFELMIQNPRGPEITGGYNVHYVVVEEGIYTEAEDGIKMEALLLPSEKTARKGKWVKEKRIYQNMYTDPVVVGQVQTYNDPDWSVFWASTQNKKNPPNNKLYAGKHVGEDWDATRNTETIGYIVIEAGEGLINNVPFVAGVGPRIVKGYDNSSNGYLYTFNSLPTASTAILSVAGMSNDGGWPVLLGLNPLTSTSVRLIYDEDVIKDAERKHPKEKVAYIIFGSN